MRTLVIDCATPALSLALFENGRCVAHRHAVMGRGHAEAIVPQLDAMLAGARADAVAVDVGPGSFTGIRVGLAAARALGFAWGVPVEGYGCLSLCAAIVGDRDPGGDAPIAIVMVGGHGEFFWQRFDRASLAPLAPVSSTPMDLLAATLEDPVLHGSAAAALIAARGWGQGHECLPDARAWPLLPASEARLAPIALYGRGADARPMGMPAGVEARA